MNEVGEKKKEKIEDLQSRISSLCYCELRHIKDLLVYSIYVPVILREDRRVKIDTRSVNFCPECGSRVREEIVDDYGVVVK